LISEIRVAPRGKVLEKICYTFLRKKQKIIRKIKISQKILKITKIITRKVA